MPTKEKPNLDSIRKEIQAARDDFSTGFSRYAGRIDKVLTDFDEFAVRYKDLWQELLGKISRSQQDSDAIELVNVRIQEFWSALHNIVYQYKDEPYKPKVEEGMNYLTDLCKKNDELFPSPQADPDVLIFIKKEKVSIARRYPFTNTFFIGISDLSVQVENTTADQDDWRPIAHELGHYFYWYSCFDTMEGNNIRARVDQDPIFGMDIENTLNSFSASDLPNEFAKMALSDLMTSWSEEIFADLVGTRLLGKNYADSSKGLFNPNPEDKSGNSLARDIDHPIPYLRPFICAEGLKLVEEKRNLVWSKFKATFDSTFEETQKLSVGWVTNDSDDGQFNEFQFSVPTMQNAIKQIIPVIYNKFETKEPIIDQSVGIDAIKERLETAFLNSYLELAEEMEKGNLWGLVRRFRRGSGKVITTFTRR